MGASTPDDMPVVEETMTGQRFALMDLYFHVEVLLCEDVISTGENMQRAQKHPKKRASAVGQKRADRTVTLVRADEETSGVYIRTHRLC